MNMVQTARQVAQGRSILPRGVALRSLDPHRDERGTFTELFRDEWALGPHPKQWNGVRSASNVLRGVHAHKNHADYLTVVQGEMLLLLHDLREGSATFQATTTLRLHGDDPHLVVIPTEVAHGFFFAEPGFHIYAVTETFDGTDEFGCRWNEPQLKAAWPCPLPNLSARDERAGSYEDMLAALRGGTPSC